MQGLRCWSCRGTSVYSGESAVVASELAVVVAVVPACAGRLALACHRVTGEREEHVVQGRTAYRDAGDPDAGRVKSADHVGSDPFAARHVRGDLPVPGVDPGRP